MLNFSILGNQRRIYMKYSWERGGKVCKNYLQIEWITKKMKTPKCFLRSSCCLYSLYPSPSTPAQSAEVSQLLLCHVIIMVVSGGIESMVLMKQHSILEKISEGLFLFFIFMDFKVIFSFIYILYVVMYLYQYLVFTTSCQYHNIHFE